MEKIDFVILWVDGNDEKWIEEKNKYLDIVQNESAAVNRFRDWKLLKYWFRGVEHCTPWVNKVYFVTWGHLPDWLDVTNKKLVVVNHKDFIPEDVLPTFNSTVIERYLHNIIGLSEQFVYFNDDMFLLQKIKPEYFFKKGLPVGAFIESPISMNDFQDTFNYQRINNTIIINRHFSKKQIIKQNFTKCFNLRYGRYNINNLILNCWKQYAGFQFSHLPTPFLKSTFEEVWDIENEYLSKTSFNRFRNKTDINQYLFANWQWCTGKFIPVYPRVNGYFEIGNQKSIDAISNKKYKMICLNDVDETVNYDEEQRKIEEGFIKLFPEKSSYEK